MKQIYVFDCDIHNNKILNLCVTEYNLNQNKYTKNFDKRLYLQLKPKSVVDDLILSYAYEFGVDDRNVLKEINKITDYKCVIDCISINNCIELLIDYFDNEFCDLPTFNIIKGSISASGDTCENRSICIK